MTSWRRTMSNPRWNNIVYVNVDMYNVEHCPTNVVYFKVDIKSVRQRWNNVVIFNLEFHNVDQRRNNAVNMTIYTKLKRAKKYFFELQKQKERRKKKKKEKKRKSKLNTLNSKFRLLFQNLVAFIPHLKRNMEKNICEAPKLLWHLENAALQELYLMAHSQVWDNFWQLKVLN